ncbi:MAG: phosphatase PAP2 family protein [Lewinella sp.]|uniref:phosphatase PAP2 family protein n=1 Tax=Lewinella sp. TaxID=2004506 RepID=UPI003D6B0AB6
MRRYLYIMIALFCFQDAFGQIIRDTTKTVEPLYKINRLTSSIIVGTGFVTNAVGLNILDDRSRVTTADLLKLDRNDVPKFERWVLDQDSGDFDRWHESSDFVMRGSLLLPVVLFAHKRIRHQALDYTLMYLKAHAINANVYTLGVPQFHRKNRPIVYYEDLDIERRTGVRLSNSFYSGHVGVTATSFFFMARVYQDLYPERSKIIPLAIAGGATTFVAYGRLKAAKHFLTDVVFGAGIGGLIGYYTPYFHRNNRNKTKKTALKLDAGYRSFRLAYTF